LSPLIEEVHSIAFKGFLMRIHPYFHLTMLDWLAWDCWQAVCS
jgi:hypothetical protein